MTDCQQFVVGTVESHQVGGVLLGGYADGSLEVEVLLGHDAMVILVDNQPARGLVLYILHLRVDILPEHVHPPHEGYLVVYGQAEVEILVAIPVHLERELLELV